MGAVTTEGASGHDLQGFSAEARRALRLAEREARSMGHAQVGTEHVLLGLLADDGTSAALALRDGGATLSAVRRKVGEAVGQAAVGPAAPGAGEPTSSPRAARAIGRAARFARDQQADSVDSDHLLLAVLDVEGTAGQVLRGLGIDIESLRTSLGGKERPTSAAQRPAIPTPTGLSPQCPSCRAELDTGVTGTAIPVTGQAGGEAVLLACPTCGYTLGVIPR
jgi:ATP-dependent Clp protease ATP-binding subunit ClpA